MAVIEYTESNRWGRAEIGSDCLLTFEIPAPDVQMPDFVRER